MPVHSGGYTRPPGTESSQWEDFREATGGSDSQIDFQNWLVAQQVSGRYDDLSNFQSPYYQQFRSFIGSIAPRFGTDQALAGQVAQGSNFATGGLIADERGKAFNRSREDFLNKTVSGFAFQSQGQANTLLGGLLENSQFQQSLNQQRYEYEDSKPDFWDYALPVLGTVGGFLLGGPAGAAAGASLFSGDFFGGGSEYGPDDNRKQGGGFYG